MLGPRRDDVVLPAVQSCQPFTLTGNRSGSCSACGEGRTPAERSCPDGVSKRTFTPPPAMMVAMRDDPTVVDLVERAREGQRVAWDQLVQRYAPLVWSVCRRYDL